MCKKGNQIYKHHIIPRYMGGCDLEENLVAVNITQHAMFHFCNYQLWKNQEDKLAWKMLSGQISKEDAIIEARNIGRKNQHLNKDEKGRSLNTLKLHKQKDNLGRSIHALNAFKESTERKKKKVEVIHIETGKKFVFESTNEAARQLNLSQGNLHNTITGRYKHHKGYIGRYI